MTGKVKGKDLHEAVAKVGRAVEVKRTLPILTHALLKKAGDAGLSLRATDLEVTVEVTIPASWSGEFTAVVPLQELRAAATVTMDDMELGPIPEMNGQAFRVGPSTMRTMPAEEFPAIPDEGLCALTMVDGAALKAAIKAVAPAMSTDKTRPLLCTVALDIEEKHVVATDGHRLHFVPFDYGGEPVASQLKQALLPLRAVRCLVGCLETGEVAIRTRSEGDLLQFVGPGFTLWTRLVDGTFPNWTQVVPNLSKKPHVEIPRKEFVEYLKAVVKVPSGYRELCYVNLSENGDTLDAVFIRGNGELPTLGRNFLVKGNLPKNGTIGFNPRYLLDAFCAYTGETIHLWFTSYAEPGMFVDPSSGLRTVIMPIKNGDEQWRVIAGQIVRHVPAHEETAKEETAAQ